MDIESQMHIVAEIASYPADIEGMDTYEDRIHQYKNNNYTYIPLPLEGAYFDTEEGWMRDIESSQIVHEETHIMTGLRKLQQHPFLLVNYEEREYVVLEDDEESFPFPKSLANMVEESKFDISDDDFLDIDNDELVQQAKEKDALNSIELRRQYPELADSALDLEFEEQFGIVTLADLNKRPVKQMLYKVISELGAMLSDKIETEHPDSESLFELLRPETIGRWKKDQMEGLSIHIAEHMNILEMMQVIQSSSNEVVKNCGFDSKQGVEDLHGINEIRKRVMHSNRSLVYDRKEIQEIIDVVNDSQRIINNSR